jgi:hypothetical protein
MEVMNERNARVERILARLDEVHRTTTDSDLRIYLAEVRSVLGSKVLENMRVTLPLDRPPYKPLAAYCQRRAAKPAAI